MEKTRTKRIQRRRHRHPPSTQRALIQPRWRERKRPGNRQEHTYFSLPLSSPRCSAGCASISQDPRSRIRSSSLTMITTRETSCWRPATGEGAFTLQTRRRCSPRPRLTLTMTAMWFRREIILSAACMPMWSDIPRWAGADWRSISNMIFCIPICRFRTRCATTTRKTRRRSSIRATT